MKKIFSFLKDTFFWRKRIYLFQEEKETVLSRLHSLFSKEYGYFLDKGDSYLTTDDFKFRPTSIFPGSSLLFEIKNAYLNGSVVTDGSGKTKIIIKIRANSSNFVVFVIAFFGGIIAIVQSISKGDFRISLFALLCSSIVMFISIVLARMYALSFLEKFENFLGIKHGTDK